MWSLYFENFLKIRHFLLFTLPWQQIYMKFSHIFDNKNRISEWYVSASKSVLENNVKIKKVN